MGSKAKERSSRRRLVSVVISLRRRGEMFSSLAFVTTSKNYDVVLDSRLNQSIVLDEPKRVLAVASLS